MCTPLGRQSVLCNGKLRCLFSFCLLFSTRRCTQNFIILNQVVAEKTDERDIFHQSFLKHYLIKDHEIFNNCVFSLKVLQPLMASELCSLLAIFFMYLSLLVFFFLFFFVLVCLYVLSSFAIILMRKREMVDLLLLSFDCLVTVNVL